MNKRDFIFERYDFINYLFRKSKPLRSMLTSYQVEFRRPDGELEWCYKLEAAVKSFSKFILKVRAGFKCSTIWKGKHRPFP